MTFTTWGQTATHSTTVSASPTPTTTSCTVASVGSFREGMAVYFDVSGTPERTFLTGITGNALTFSPALSGAPDVGGDAVSYHQPIFNDKLNESALWRPTDLADLKATDTTGMADGTLCFLAGYGIYKLDTGSSSTGDDFQVIDPTTGPGRWLLQMSGGGSSASSTITTDTTAVPGKTYICNSTDPIDISAPSSPSVGQEIGITSINSGTWLFSLVGSQSIKFKDTVVTGTNFGIKSTQAYTSVKLLYSASNTWNVISSDGTYTTKNLKGFILGGGSGDAKDTVSIGSIYTSIEDLNFSSEASAAISATIPPGFIGSAGVNAKNFGYMMGGDTGGSSWVNTIERLGFVSETTSTIAATLDTSRSVGSGVQSSTKGYILGGYTGSASSAIDDLTFSTEASVALAETLDTAVRGGAGVQSSTKGYAMGDGSYASLIQDFTFTSELAATLSATLAGNMAHQAGVSSSTKGYAMGGFNGTSRASSIEALTFSGETMATLGATLDTAKQRPAGVYSSTKGYAMGGYIGSADSSIEDLNFSTEASVALAATLDTARSSGAGLSYGL